MVVRLPEERAHLLTVLRSATQKLICPLSACTIRLLHRGNTLARTRVIPKLVVRERKPVLALHHDRGNTAAVGILVSLPLILTARYSFYLGSLCCLPLCDSSACNECLLAGLFTLPMFCAEGLERMWLPYDVTESHSGMAKLHLG